MEEQKSLEKVFTILIEERLVESVPVGCKLNRNNIFRGKGKDREMSPAPGIEQQSLDQLETVSRVQKKISHAAGEVDADTLWRVNANEFNRRFGTSPVQLSFAKSSVSQRVVYSKLCLKFLAVMRAY